MTFYSCELNYCNSDGCLYIILLSYCFILWLHHPSCLKGRERGGFGHPHYLGPVAGRDYCE